MSLIPIHLSRITHAHSKRRVLTPILTRHTPQPYEHMKTKPVAGVYSYSFALRPSEVVQPSGSCNFSRYVT